MSSLYPWLFSGAATIWVSFHMPQCFIVWFHLGFGGFPPWSSLCRFCVLFLASLTLLQTLDFSHTPSYWPKPPTDYFWAPSFRDSDYAIRSFSEPNLSLWYYFSMILWPWRPTSNRFLSNLFSTMTRLGRDWCVASSQYTLPKTLKYKHFLVLYSDRCSTK